MDSYLDLRMRGEGDVDRTIEIIPGVLMVDVDDDGRALGIEKVGSEPIESHDLLAVIMRGHFKGAMNIANLDFSDPEIRRMIACDHTPEEIWSMMGELASVNCSMCGNSWPCPSIVRLRAHIGRRRSREQ